MIRMNAQIVETQPHTSRLAKLIRFQYMSQDWIDLIPQPFLTFLSTIAPHLSTTEFYPAPIDIFRAFKECPEEKLKVVILGQDPYSGTYKIGGIEFPEATGLAFDNSLLQPKTSPSLKNLIKELNSDIESNNIASKISYLGHLPEQGVLLLNTALTIEPNITNSHKELWETFTKEVIEGLNCKDNIVWVLLGKQAQSYKNLITNNTHSFVEAVHPSPLSAGRGFFGSKIFSKVNQALESKGLQTINW